MAYTKTNWQTGDVIDATKLNHAEDGIAQAQETADTANARDSLADLTDVEITGTPTDGQVILYDATNSKWVNGSAGGGGVEYVNVYDNTSTNSNIKLTVNLVQILELINSGKIPYIDVQSTITYSDSYTSNHQIPKGKYFLTRIEQYSSTYAVMFSFYKFVGTSHTALPKMSMLYNTITRLQDIQINTSLATGAVLVYNYPTKVWQTKLPTMSLLTDVSISTPTNGQVLRYNGTRWVNGTAPASVQYRRLVYDYNDNYDKNTLMIYTSTAGTEWIENMDALVDTVLTEGVTMIYIASAEEAYAITSITKDQNSNYIIHTTSQSYTFVRDTDNNVFVLQQT